MTVRQLADICTNHIFIAYEDSDGITRHQEYRHGERNRMTEATISKLSAKRFPSYGCVIVVELEEEG